MEIMFPEVRVDNASKLKGILADSWIELLKDFIDSPRFSAIMAAIKADKAKGIRVYPHTKDIFKIFNVCKLEDIKVVIGLQD